MATNNIPQEFLDSIKFTVEKDFAMFSESSARDLAAGRVYVDFDVGSAYVKIVMNRDYGWSEIPGRSVIGFIVNRPDPKNGFNVGDVLKANGWKAPAKNFVRFTMAEWMAGKARDRFPWTGVR